ncbi:MAG: hypothetical protein GXP30_12735, partial [Verrucomicrobia bacterium]|nr:hypothetical protein [Verrucomicrobiota bacterium]
MHRLSSTFTLLFALLVLSTSYAQDRFAKWEKSIAAFETADQKSPPPERPVLFVGSSSIRMWNLNQFFPKLKTLNRGFGGSTLADSIHFFDRIIKPYHPKVIVLYAGDNDMAKGLSPKEVLKDFKTLSGKVKTSLPDTPLIYIAIKPSISRKKLWPEMKQANDLIAAYCAQTENLYFADIARPMLEQNLSPDLFKTDGLHLTDKGYELWKRVLLIQIKKSQ